MLTQPVLLPNIIAYKGFKALAFVGGSADNVYSVDYDLNRVFWQQHLATASTTPATAACPGGLTAITKSTAAAPGSRRSRTRSGRTWRCGSAGRAWRDGRGAGSARRSAAGRHHWTRAGRGGGQALQGQHLPRRPQLRHRPRRERAGAQGLHRPPSRAAVAAATTCLRSPAAAWST